MTTRVGFARRSACASAVAAALLAGCGTRPATPGPLPAKHGAPSANGTTPPAASATTPAFLGDFGSTPEGLTFAWAGGYVPPPWLPAFVRKAPAAPSGGSIVCGVNPATALYTALVRYDPAHPSGAITIQVQGFHGPGAYANASGSAAVDVEVSPPAPDLTGLSGFGVDGATVLVAADMRSGTLTSRLQSGPLPAATISGSWRCG